MFLRKLKKNGIKKFFIKYFFLVNDGFDHYLNLSKVTSNKRIKINFNKFSILFNIRRFIIFVLQIIFFPFALLMYLTNTKIVSANPFTIGNCIEEIECILKRNLFRKKKYNLIFFAPPQISHNNYLPDFFETKLTVLRSVFWAILIIPLSHYRFCLENAVIKNNTSCVFPTQYTNKINKDGAINQNILSHNIIFDELLNYKKKDHKFIDFKNSLKKTVFNKIKKKYDLRNKKFCIFHFRNEEIHKTRNNSFKNYYKSINYLLKKNYKIIILSSTIKLKKKNIIIIDPSNKDNHIDQFYLINYCDLYVGPLSGPWALANLLKKKIILTNTVVFNFPIINNNFINLPKHFYKKNKQKKLTIKEIFENKLECCWKYDDLRKKNVYLRDNTSNEILKVIKFSFNKKKRFISFKNEKFYKRQKFKEFLIINKIPFWY